MLCSAFGHLVRDTLSLVNSFESFSFSHSYRQDNVVAHVLAKRVRFLFIFILKKRKRKRKERVVKWSVFIHILCHWLCRSWLIQIN